MEEPRSLAERQTFNPRRRMRKVQSMRSQLGLERWRRGAVLDHPEFDEPSTVSVGIEIEMTWRHVMPELALEWHGTGKRPMDCDKDSIEYQEFLLAYDAYDQALRPVLQEIVRPTIPKVGEDAYWEFSFLPSKDLQITVAELSSLYESGILSDNMEYALHMTVADVASDRDAFALMCFLELDGGTTPGRIMQAANTQNGTWSRKGEGGLAKRHETELVGAQTGYEFRTLAATSYRQVAQLLYTAQSLGELITSEDPQELHEWIVIRNQVEEFLASKGLPLEAWQSPKEETELWQKYANLIGHFKLNQKDA